MAVTVRLPGFLKNYTNGATTLAVADANTVGEVLRRFASDIEGLAPKLFDANGRVQRNLNVFLNADDIRFLNHLDTPVRAGDEVSIISGIAGG